MKFVNKRDKGTALSNPILSCHPLFLFYESGGLRLIVLRNTCIISLLRKLKINTSGNVKYKCNDTENFSVENLLNVRKEKITGLLCLLNFHYNDNRIITTSSLGGSHYNM